MKYQFSEGESIEIDHPSGMVLKVKILGTPQPASIDEPGEGWNFYVENVLVNGESISRVIDTLDEWEAMDNIAIDYLNAHGGEV